MSSRLTNQKGQILVESLIAIAVAAIILSLSAYFIQSGSQGERRSQDKFIASQLAQETFEATKVISEADWNDIWYDSDYSIGSSLAYYLKNNAGDWILTTNIDDQAIVIDGKSYQRSLVFYNVSRDTSTKNIELTYVQSRNDASTRKVIVSITGEQMANTNWTFYLTRWKNDTQAEDEWEDYTGDESGFIINDQSGSLELKP